MNLWEIQSFVKEQLDNNPVFTENGVVSILDDGSYPKLPGLEAALRDKGLAIIIWRIGSLGVLDVTKTGLSNQLIHIAVVIQENEAVNRSATGTNILPEKALQLVFETLSGRPASTPPETPLLPYQEPFENFGKVNGVLTIVANFTKQHRITPV